MMPLQTVLAFLDTLTPAERAVLIIAVTVLVVTGMWVGLYKRGKK